MKKRTISLLLALVMVFGLLPVSVLAAEDTEPNNTLPTAQEITVGDTISGEISEDKDADWYKFTLDAPGRVSCKAISYMEYYSMWLYDEEGSELWKSYSNAANEASGMRTDTYDLDLTEGTFYLKISGQYTSGISNYYASGNYKLTTTYTCANVNEPEPNDSIQEAQTIPLNGSINGQCALNNKNDYFMLELPADGQLTLTMTAHMEYYSLWVYDAKGIELWKDYANSANAATGMSRDTYEIYLDAGTYYLGVSGQYTYGIGYSYASGTYTLDTSYVSADVDETELNDSVQEADAFPLNVAFDGLCTLNNKNDYFRFELLADHELTLTVTSYMDHYSIWLYDFAGNEIWNDLSNSRGYTADFRQDITKHKLTQGTYYIKGNTA